MIAPDEIGRFFALLFDRTDGLVILDFIDLGSWDQIESYAFDHETRDLELHWHDYRALDAVGGRSDLTACFLPASLYGLLIRVQEIRIVRGSGTAAFLLSGYALDRKEINR